MKKFWLSINTIVLYHCYLVFLFCCLALLAIANGTGLVAAQKQAEGGCPLIEAVDDVPLASPQPDPNCQSGQSLTPEDDSIELWITAASAGTVDEADASIVNLSGPIANIRTVAPAPAALDIRYNVVPVDGLYFGGASHVMTARFKDNGSAAQVIVQLKRYNLNTGAVSTLLTLDSNTFPANSLYQTQDTSTSCPPGWAFDFLTYAYFIEVTITKSAAGGDPGLSAIQLGNNEC